MSGHNGSQSTVLRLFELYRNIPSPNSSGVTTTALHQRLLSEGYNVTKRTVERDLIKLEQVTEIYPETTPEGNLWRNSRENTDKLPVMQPSEALLLVIAENALAKALPPENHALLQQRLTKAHTTLENANKLSRWQDKLYIIAGDIPKIGHVGNLDVRKVVYDAVIAEEQIELTYYSAEREQESGYQLNPLAIIVRDHNSYLVATKIDSPDKPQLFVFSRMKSVVRLYQAITHPKSFDLKSYVDSNPTGWLIDKDMQNVVLKVKWYALEWLRNNQLQPNQIIEPADGDWSRITFHGHVTYDLIAWILRFSTDVVVEKPQTLRQEVIERLREMLGNYE
jgi:predicted DNA-binding transcriptional regulator YafY